MAIPHNNSSPTTSTRHKIIGLAYVVTGSVLLAMFCLLLWRAHTLSSFVTVIWPNASTFACNRLSLHLDPATRDTGSRVATTIERLPERPYVLFSVPESHGYYELYIPGRCSLATLERVSGILRSVPGVIDVSQETVNVGD
jgi:hypothetical protein